MTDEIAPTPSEVLAEEIEGKIRRARAILNTHIRSAEHHLSGGAAVISRADLLGIRDGLNAALRAGPPERKIEALYNELIMSVATKWHGESRHDTARRYIRQREEYQGDETLCAKWDAAASSGGKMRG